MTQSFQNQLPVELAQILNTSRIHPGQCSADRGNIGQTRYAEKATHHRIILVVAQILQSTITDQQVDDKQEHNRSCPKMGLTPR